MDAKQLTKTLLAALNSSDNDLEELFEQMLDDGTVKSVDTVVEEAIISFIENNHPREIDNAYRDKLLT